MFTFAWSNPTTKKTSNLPAHPPPKNKERTSQPPPFCKDTNLGTNIYQPEKISKRKTLKKPTNPSKKRKQKETEAWYTKQSLWKRARFTEFHVLFRGFQARISTPPKTNVWQAGNSPNLLNLGDIFDSFVCFHGCHFPLKTSILPRFSFWKFFLVQQKPTAPRICLLH